MVLLHDYLSRIECVRYCSWLCGMAIEGILEEEAASKA